MAWDERDSVLFIGGLFHSIDNDSISAGLAMWSRETGLVGLPTRGVTNGQDAVDGCSVQAIAYEATSSVWDVLSSLCVLESSN